MYDITPRIYGFASGDATYDGIQKLSIRGVPKIGAGYKLWEEKLDADRRNFLQAEAGGAGLVTRAKTTVHRIDHGQRPW